MFFCPESVLLDIFIGDFDEDKESIFMKLGDSAWKWLNTNQCLIYQDRLELKTQKGLEVKLTEINVKSWPPVSSMMH